MRKGYTPFLFCGIIITGVMIMKKLCLLLICMVLLTACNSNENLDLNKITNIADIDKLELTDYYVAFGDLIKAFINHDTDTIEDYAFLERGLYKDYKTLVIGDYEIIREDDVEPYGTMIYFNFEIIESGMDTFPPGKYKTFIEDGLTGTIINYIRDENEMPDTPVIDTVYKWFRTCSNLIITPEIISEMSDSIRSDISEMVMSFLPPDDNGHTLEDIQACALKYYGIDNFMPGGVVGTFYDDKYVVGGHGGEIWRYDVTDYDDTSVTLQFYADYSMTVKSHLINYILTKVEDNYIITDCEIITESQFQPYHISV